MNVAHCAQLEQAFLVRSWLESCGIRAFIPDEFVAQTAPQYLFASPSRIRVQVPAGDAAAARRALAEAERHPHQSFAAKKHPPPGPPPLYP